MRSLLLVLSVLGACSRDAASTNGAGPPTPGTTPGTTPDTSAPPERPAATPSPDPSAALACRTNDDCAIVNGLPPRCCSRCSATAMTRAAAEEARRACAAEAAKRTDYFASCPHLSCPCVRESAVCRDGRCAVDSRPCR